MLLATAACIQLSVAQGTIWTSYRPSDRSSGNVRVARYLSRPKVEFFSEGERQKIVLSFAEGADLSRVHFLIEALYATNFKNPWDRAVIGLSGGTYNSQPRLFGKAAAVVSLENYRVFSSAHLNISRHRIVMDFADSAVGGGECLELNLRVLPHNLEMNRVSGSWLGVNGWTLYHALRPVGQFFRRRTLPYDSNEVPG